MEEFIKAYGSVLSPTIAFVLGIAAVYLKIGIERKMDKKRAYTSFGTLIAMLSKVTLPPYSQPITKGHPDAGTLRNITHLSRLYFGLSSINAYLEKITTEIRDHGDALMIHQAYYLGWRLEKFIKTIDDMRVLNYISEEQYGSVQRDLPELLLYLDEDWFSLRDLSI